MSTNQGTTIHVDLRGDELLRAKLKADPRKLIEETQGISVPAGVQIQIAEETAEGVVLFVARDAASSDALDQFIQKAAANDDELSDELLDMVSAGSSGFRCSANGPKNEIGCSDPRY